MEILHDYSLGEIKNLIEEMGEKPFRAGQIFRGIRLHPAGANSFCFVFCVYSALFVARICGVATRSRYASLLTPSLNAKHLQKLLCYVLIFLLEKAN